MTIYWRPHHEWNSNLPPAPDFIAFDDEELIGRVFQIQYGQGQGRWVWTMTVGPPGLRLTFATSGVEDRRGEAGRRVVEAYERLRRRPA